MLKFLGCGSGYNPSFGNTNAYFSSEGTFYLIDCGFTAFDRLLKLDEFLNSSKLVVLITHLHADHSGSLPMLVSYASRVLERKAAVVFPDTCIRTFFSVTGIPEEDYLLVSDLSGNGSQILAEPVPVRHSPLLPCFGYRLFVHGKNLYYSGDAGEIPEKIVEDFRDGRIHTIYQDVMSRQDPSGSHGSLLMLNALFPRPMRRNIICMHYDVDFLDRIKENGYGYVRGCPDQEP